ncbi:MAG: tol-pal system protein YbgF [Hyphomicrobium sp.]
MGMIVRKACITTLVPMVGCFPLMLAALVVPVGGVYAQNAAPAGATPPAASTQAPQKPAGAKAPTQKAAAPAAGGDSALRQRVEQLEEQIVDMQVVIGTLESLAKAPPQSPNAAPMRSLPAAGGAESARVDSLEQQLKSLSAQMQQLSNDVRAQRTDRRSDISTGTAPPLPGAQPPAPATVSSFGSTTVTSSQSDPIGGILAGEQPPAKVGESLPEVPGAAASSPLSPPAAVAALPPAGGGDPQQMYSGAYGYLLGQNYGAAQTGFEEFLRRYPRDALAPDALFWLGEAHYMQKNYNDAAEALDLVTASYGSSAKAPEAQLRRAASLLQLGRKDDACAALRQLSTKYPSARPVVKTKAEAERQRAGCS